MTKHITRKPVALNLPAVQGWAGSSDMMVDANRIQESFISGRIDAESARLLVANMRNAIALLALQLDHAKLSKRIETGSTSLPSFEFQSLPE